jgi:hypothetical protein
LLPYWLLFLLWTVGAVQSERRRAEDPRVIFFIGAAVITALMIGFRYQVGGDWGTYQGIYESIFFLSLPDALGTTDAGYAALNWIAAKTNFSIVFVNMICAALFMSGVARLAWRQPNPALAIVVAVPYFIIVVAMGYTRQAAAIGVLCFAIADVSERHLFRLMLLVGIAALFHKTALLMLPVALVPIFRRNLLLGIIGGIVFLLLFVVLLGGASDKMVANYVQSDYDSQGANIRVAMNVAAAALFLLLRKRIIMPAFQRSFWITCCCLAIASIGGLIVSSASSGVDRLSLYLIPLQMVTYSRLPYIVSSTGRAVTSVLIIVILYCFLVQFVWLNYADNVWYWVPYHLSFLRNDV